MIEEAMKNIKTFLVIISILLVLFFVINFFVHKRTLEYVNATNAGLLGYFSDGTIASCSKCDFVWDNVSGLYKAEVTGSWDKSGLPESFEEDQKDAYLKSTWVMAKSKWLQFPER